MADETPEIVTCSTFVRDLTESEISEVNIFDYGREVDLTYKTAEGEMRATKGPIGLDDDTLLSFTLTSQEVPFVIHAEEYGSGESSFEWYHLSTLIFFLIPVLLLFVIVRQSKTIRSLGDALVRASSQPKAGSEGNPQ
ncbi:hypothetical protein N8522_05930 [Akkermansiaceae bacterium]|nr:hypothetical protein [Akkermansiaceae bacterium]MDB4374796.1 hypothetical protein [bacterium]MDB4282930.1 hypothetical protein [Akkermansiaceae bacterium]MDB4554804.1 hypothetical protein [Akkermansiaceae bacterium]MDB4630108.1 hypothetical protein [Akkermansiaceae bacterium]